MERRFEYQVSSVKGKQERLNWLVSRYGRWRVIRHYEMVKRALGLGHAAGH